MLSVCVCGAVVMIPFIIFSLYLRFSYLNEVMEPYGTFSPTAWAIIHSIEAFCNSGR